jgi:vacuolar-type H+-ATPase subunit B/Vma2
MPLRIQGPTSMIDLATEKRTLIKANRDIAEGEERIGRQIDLIGRLRDGGHSVVDAQALLQMLQETLQAWRGHREEILRTIARLEDRDGSAAGPASSPSN